MRGIEAKVTVNVVKDEEEVPVVETIVAEAPAAEAAEVEVVEEEAGE